VHAGEKIAVLVRGNCLDGTAHHGGAIAEFFAPGRDPQHDPGDREPDSSVPLGFDPVTRTYGADVPTAAWAPGTWTVRGAVLGADGEPEGWGWYSFTLEP
jgi:hypothetical protein